MPVNKRRILDSVLIVLSFFIPLNLYIIGNWYGTGLQFCFFRYQDTYAGSSLVTLFRELIIVIYNDWGYRSTISYCAWLAAVLVLISAAILHLFQDDILKLLGSRFSSRYRKWIGTHFALAAILILLSVIFQYGPFLTGSAGVAIPIGVPLFIAYAWYFRATPLPVTPSEETVRSEGKYAWIYIAAYLALITGLVFLVVNQVTAAFLYSGWDFRIYCAAANAFRAGQNPYDLEVLGRFSPPLQGVDDIIGVFVYPPLTLLMFDPLCSGLSDLSSIRLYYFLYAFILLAGIAIVWHLPLKDHDRLYGVILYGTGLLSLYWSIGTGNISIIYGPISALIFYFLLRKKYTYSALSTALLSAFNLFPILFLSLYSVVPVSVREKAKIIVIALGAFLLWLVSSYFWNPDLFFLYLYQLRGGSSPVHEIGGFTTPTGYTFIVDILNYFSITSPWAIITAVLIFLIVVLALFARYALRNREDTVFIFSYGFLAVFLLLPRLKCNYFVFILIPIYILTRTCSLRMKAAFLVVVSLIPAVLYPFYPTYLAKETLLAIFLAYNQFICSFIAFIMIWLQDEMRKDGTGSSLPSAERQAVTES